MICDVITCCVRSCDMGTDDIMIENQKKHRGNMESKHILQKSPSVRPIRNGIHSLLRQADAWWRSTDVIYILCEAYCTACGWGIVRRQKSRSLTEYVMNWYYLSVRLILYCDEYILSHWQASIHLIWYFDNLVVAYFLGATLYFGFRYQDGCDVCSCE